MFKRIKKLYILLALVVILAVALYLWKISRLPVELEVYVFNTKGTPSIFIRTPEDKRILINGGSNSEIIKYITGIIPFYSRYINTIIVTHDDGNTVSGLVDIINRYKVDEVILPSVDSVSSGISSSTDQIYQIFIDTVKQKLVQIKKVGEGDTFDLLKNGSGNKGNRLIAQVLFPSDSFAYSKASSPEMVLKLVYGENSFLVLGNVSTKIQKYILNEYCIDIPIKIGEKTKQNCSENADYKLNSDILIIPHSTSINLFAPNFIESVKPEYLIHSQLETSNKKSKSIIDPFYFILDNKRFDVKQKNTIKVFSDGNSIEIK